MFGRKEQPEPISDEGFLSILYSFSGLYAWYEEQLYNEARYKEGGPTLEDAAYQPDLNVTAKLLVDLHSPETVSKERDIFASALRRNARKIEERGYLREAADKRRLAGRILLPQTQRGKS